MQGKMLRRDVWFSYRIQDQMWLDGKASREDLSQVPIPKFGGPDTADRDIEHSLFEKPILLSYPSKVHFQAARAAPSPKMNTRVVLVWARSTSQSKTARLS